MLGADGSIAVRGVSPETRNPRLADPTASR
jgi:hypothetical protein